MKLLAIEASQNRTYFLSRYEQLQAFGADLYVLNGEGTPDLWPAERYRIVGSKSIDNIVASARSWHEQERFDGV
ncbi:MAG: ATP-grasp domain-containing protein, partial [Pseudonocardiaceae bacterium]